ncbi:formyltransferase family protein [Paracraurococcus lichenis]|uniref:Formyltransferase family protein n=1 Tax=Paracraurococcus lichenis TaxID=3064888 RepID=A0ABT9E613_9PROT|nr:formyltransferase family protein [Paracraurococcus sp. LOR1-02]MDO9711537.1 formyltransferase family protein [Paracraurococcus sp. LOR1-02]
MTNQPIPVHPALHMMPGHGPGPATRSLDRFLACLEAAYPGTATRRLEGARWGRLLLPPGPVGLPKAPDAVRIVLLGSFWIGRAALQAVLAYLHRYPGRVDLVAVVTDDPLSPEARISLRKRAWALMTEGERLEMKLALVGSAFDIGCPVYTGEIKTPGFRRMLAAWRPHAIVTCGFGQVLDTAILQSVPAGAYNCHPSDLARGLGAGPSPWADLAARNGTEEIWTLHRMTEVVDGGPVVGQTAPVNLADPQGRPVAEPMVFFDRMLLPVGWMVLRLLDSLAQRHAAGLTGPLRSLDLVAGMPDALHAALREPVRAVHAAPPIPTPGEAEFGALPEATARHPGLDAETLLAPVMAPPDGAVYPDGRDLSET